MSEVCDSERHQVAGEIERKAVKATRYTSNITNALGNFVVLSGALKRREQKANLMFSGQDIHILINNLKYRTGLLKKMFASRNSHGSRMRSSERASYRV